MAALSIDMGRQALPMSFSNRYHKFKTLIINKI